MSMMMAVQVAGAAASYYMQGEINKEYDEVRKYQTQTAEAQRKFNLEQVQKAYAQNYAQTMNQFVDARVDVSNQMLTQMDTVSQQLGAVSNVELSESSFNYEQAKATADQDFLNGLNKISEAQNYSMLELQAGKQAQQFQVEEQYQNLISSINGNYGSNLQSGAGGQLMGSITDAYKNWDSDEISKFADMFNTGGGA